MAATTLAETFTDSLGRLPNEIKASVVNSIELYKRNRNANGLNFEKLSNTRDEDFYSIRVNDNYRIICKCPGGSETPIFLYVDKHDKAYDWAKKHTCSIDVNGVMTVHGATEPARKIIKGKPASRLSALTDEDFEKIAVPEDFREKLREKVFTSNALVGFKDALSEETYLILEEILKGQDKNEALAFYEQLVSEIIVPVTSSRPIFDISPVQLTQLGIPAEYVDLVASVKSVEELQTIQSKLPANAVQNLYSYLDGEKVDSLIRSTTQGNKPVEENDVTAALKNIGTKQTITVIENDEELRRLLEMPMEKWRVFLHPTQRRVVEAEYNGPARILGGAGTGKTVIVVHRAKYLAKQCTASEKVLVTTFSRTLAQDIYTRLSKICSQSELKHIEISTLDSITNQIIEKMSLHIAYDKAEPGFKQSRIRYAWNKARGDSGITRYDVNFLIAEWRDVIQGQNIKTKEAYLVAQRTGRGTTRADRAAREDIWKVFESYQNLMKSKSWIDIDWAQNACAEFLATKQPQGKYRHILVDECQDFKAPAFRMLRALAGPERQNDMFLSGDSRQRIYDGRCSLSNCGINVRNRSTQLKVNYRTTREIYELSLKLQNGFIYDDLDNNAADRDESVCTMHGEVPIIKGFEHEADEKSEMLKNLKFRLSEGFIDSEICIVAKTNDLAKKFADYLTNNKVKSLLLGQNQDDDKSIHGVRVATMHRVKGMEFDCMYVVSANREFMPFAQIYNNPDNDKNEILKQEANLLSVAITRARKTVWISYYGTPSELIDKIK